VSSGTDPTREPPPREQAAEPGAASEPHRDSAAQPYADDTLPSEQTGGPATQPAPNMLPGRERRRFGAERLLMRLIATFGIIAIGVAIAAIMQSSNSKGWLIGLVVACVSVILSAVLWSSRQI
jgi:hypothetical protein